MVKFHRFIFIYGKAYFYRREFKHIFLYQQYTLYYMMKKIFYKKKYLSSFNHSELVVIFQM